jgi:hypothetical protein
MKEDIVLLVVVSAVWVVLAVLYATVPMFAMPGYASVWGVGSVIFLLLAGMILVAEMRGRNETSSSGKQADTEKRAGE